MFFRFFSESFQTGQLSKEDLEEILLEISEAPNAILRQARERVIHELQMLEKYG